MKVVYIAGPFNGATQRQIADNVNRAEDLAEIVIDCGAMPLIPHSNTRNFGGCAPESFFYEGTLELMRRCDAVMMLTGWRKSKGASAEYAEAIRLKMPIFYQDVLLQRNSAGHGSFEQWVNT